jgi:hypothetical protein
VSCWDSEHSRVMDEAFDDASPEVVSLIPDHVAGMRLAVMLAARGVNGDGLAGLVAEAERVGRMADALCALVARIGDTGDAVRALADAADVLESEADALTLDPAVLQLEDGLRVAAHTLSKTD